MNKMTLNNEFYREEQLIKCVEDFSQLADIKVKGEVDCWFVEFSDCTYGVDRTQKEFENYLIELTYQDIIK